MPARQEPDIENPPDRKGFPALAAWIARNADYDTFIFRRFDRLSARNLLHLQSQLVQLEDELEQCDQEAFHKGRCDVDVDIATRNWELFATRAANANFVEHKRMKLVELISEKLKEYHEALLLQSQIASLDHPQDRARRALTKFFQGSATRHQGTGKGRPVITGRSGEYLEDKRDLVAVRQPIEKDMLSKFLQDHWIFKTTAIENNGTEHIEDHHIAWTVAAISTVLAAILLIGAIVALYFTHSIGTRLGLVAVFTALCALSVLLLTNSRRTEIFALTAAYAAVLVVFVSGNLGGPISGAGNG